MYQNYPNQYPMGMVPNQQAQMPKTGNWLSADKYALLQKGLSQFKLSVTEEELTRGQCNHYYLNNGQSALIPDADGSGGYTCAICGTHFMSNEYSQDDVQTATQNILDILNTIKILYLSLDKDAALEYFQIIPFIEKIPQLYNIAINDFKKYENVNTFMPANQQNPFNMYAMMTNPGFGGMGMMGQPQMGFMQPQMQPMGGYGAVAPQAPAGYQPQTGFNPLYGQQAPVGYSPMAPGYAPQPMYNTNMPVQPAAAPQQPQQAPVAPVAPAEEKTSVDTQFKK